MLAGLITQRSCGSSPTSATKKITPSIGRCYLFEYESAHLEHSEPPRRVGSDRAAKNSDFALTSARSCGYKSHLRNQKSKVAHCATLLFCLWCVSRRITVSCEADNRSRLTSPQLTPSGARMFKVPPPQPYREAKKDIMASNPRNLTISGVFLAFPRFFATMRFADTECRKRYHFKKTASDRI